MSDEPEPHQHEPDCLAEVLQDYDKIVLFGVDQERPEQVSGDKAFGLRLAAEVWREKNRQEPTFEGLMSEAWAELQAADESTDPERSEAMLRRCVAIGMAWLEHRKETKRMNADTSIKVTEREYREALNLIHQQAQATGSQIRQIARQAERDRSVRIAQFTLERSLVVTLRTFLETKQTAHNDHPDEFDGVSKQAIAYLCASVDTDDRTRRLAEKQLLEVFGEELA